MDLVEYELALKKQHTNITYASNYTQLKRDRALYNQFVKKTNYTICNANPNAKYSSYELRNNILTGCLYNKRVCLHTCPMF
jgi:hypothetical protein